MIGKLRKYVAKDDKEGGTVTVEIEMTREELQRAEVDGTDMDEFLNQRVGGTLGFDVHAMDEESQMRVTDWE